MSKPCKKKSGRVETAKPFVAGYHTAGNFHRNEPWSDREVRRPRTSRMKKHRPSKHKKNLKGVRTIRE